MYSVYIVTDPLEHFTKIGMTKDMKGRLADLQTGNPIELIVRTMWDFCTEQSAKDFERAIHKKYQQYRIRGEWFSDITKQEIKKIDNMYNKTKEQT